MLLSIETSTDICSVALHSKDTLVAQTISTEAYSHAERLAPMIVDLLAANRVDKKDLSAIAVSGGPGSYTGLRIGTSTAKGLCYSLDIPLIAVNTLESMLVGLPDSYTEYLKCPMIDARRMEVYCLLGYNASAIIQETHALIVDEHSFENQLKGEKILFIGNGSEKCKSVISSDNAVFLENITPEAKNIGEIATTKLDAKNFVDLAYFEPDYLKPYHAIKAKNPLA